MTNGEKFKTAKERRVAYEKYFIECREDNEDPLTEFFWLEMEYKEALELCPFCGGEPVLYKGDCCFVKCHNCDAESYHGESSEEVVAAWNRRVK